MQSPTPASSHRVPKRSHDDLEPESDISGAKRRPPDKMQLVIGVAHAARIAPQLRELLGETWRVECLTLEAALADAGEARELLAEACALVIPPIPALGKLIAAAQVRMPRLKLVQTTSAGVEFLDLGAVPQGITVCNTSSMDHAIAEYVMCAMLHHQLRFADMEKDFREAGAFLPPFRFAGCKVGPAPFHGELGEKTLGIIGFGQIGVQVARRARAFNMRVHAIASRRRDSLPEELDWIGTPADLPVLLRASHFVLVCCPLTDATRGLVSVTALAQMRTDAVLINVGRGEVIDEEALFNALKENRIRAAILDVWWQYPSTDTPEVSPSKYPFHELPNVTMTPHSSGWTSEQEVRKVAQVAHNVRECVPAQGQASFFHHICRKASA